MGMEPSVRYIKKRASPKLLEQWRAPRLVKDAGPGLTCSYGELRRDQDVLDAVEDGLFAEQGGICAYTGQSIRLGSSGTNSPRREVGFHIEHLLPQKFCTLENGRSGFKEAIRGALIPKPNQPLTRAQQETVLARLRQQVASLESGGQVTLVPYCFVIESVLSARLARTKS